MPDAAGRPPAAGPDNRHLGGGGPGVRRRVRAREDPRLAAGRLPGGDGGRASSSATSPHMCSRPRELALDARSRRHPRRRCAAAPAAAARHRALVHDEGPRRRGPPGARAGRPRGRRRVRDRRDRPPQCARNAAAASREMLRKPYLRATVFVVGLGFFIQITGINAIVYYSPRICSRPWGSRATSRCWCCPPWSRSPRWSPCSSRWCSSTGSAAVRSCSPASRMMIAANALLIGVFVVGLGLRRRADDPRLRRRCCSSPSASPSASAPWCGSTPARASRRGCAPWARARC